MKNPTDSKISRFIVLSIVLSLIGLVCVELYFGTWISSNPISQLNLLRDVEYSFDVSSLYGNSKTFILYKRDKYGLRGVYRDLAHIDILTIGGSVTDQRYVGEGQTWQDILRKEFAANGREVSIVNAGLDGQSTVGNIKNFDLWFSQLPDLRPKYILVYLGVNDLFTSAGAANDDLAGSSTFKSIVKSKSGLYRLYRTIVGTYQATFRYPLGHRRIDFPKVAWTTKAFQDRYDFIAPRLIGFERRLRILNQKIRDMGALPIYVTQASRMYKLMGKTVLGSGESWNYEGRMINGVDFYNMIRQMYEKTLDVCEEVKEICLDLEKEMVFADRDFYDYFHNTPSGCAKIGAYLHRKLKDYLSPA